MQKAKEEEERLKAEEERLKAEENRRKAEEEAKRKHEERKKLEYVPNEATVKQLFLVQQVYKYILAAS